MRTVEDYWQDFERNGFVRKEEKGKIIFSIPAHLGKGGFEVWGDKKDTVITISDCMIYHPMTIYERIEQRSLEVGEFYCGNVSTYQKKSEALMMEHGLGGHVNYPFFYGFKRVEANVPLLAVGIYFAERFVEEVTSHLSEDFWTRAAQTINYNKLQIPEISLIFSQIRVCKLQGNELNLYTKGKALEIMALLIDHIYRQSKGIVIKLSEEDKRILSEVKNHIELNFVKPPKINELTREFHINQQKLLAGFKYKYGLSIYQYIKRLRMTKALDLLKNEELLIVEVARRVGYSGDGHFQRNFKKVYGVTPYKFRQSQKGI